MQKNIITEDHPYRAWLVEYDPENPDPCFTADLIEYIEGRQAGLTPRDIAKLNEIEWFVYSRVADGLSSFAIPGLRKDRDCECRYFRRFNADAYLKMMNEFLGYVPDDFPIDQVERCRMPGYRLTAPEGDHFYPVEYNGDLSAWRKRLGDNAKHFKTSIGSFEKGRFVVSDGREIEFADMSVAGTTSRQIPPDF